ncbi:uncharacterized protein LOC135208197 [Macrobrachium nipponense]|uniref:uncharacterized protein LOC135208197 n=1 Tax=Macrobrachium nipponense TaxID=159736 RepID=UPI0030C7E11D
MEEELRYLVMCRKTVRSQVTKIFKTSGTFRSLSDVDRSTLTNRLKCYKEDLRNYDSKISSIKWSSSKDEAEFEAEFSSCQEYLDKGISLIIQLENILPLSPAEMHETPRSLLKSPVAPLPKFASSDGENIELFFRQFEETTSKFSYTDYDKLLLLKQQISGKAAVLIESLEADRQGYSHAKALLQAAFASIPVQKFNVLKQLVNMKLDENSEPFEYVSNIRKIQEAVKTLNISVDDVLQYFFLKGMNDTFKNIMIQVAGNSKPTTVQIVENFFECNERYLNVCSAIKPMEEASVAKNRLNPKSSNLAIKVDVENVNPFISCTLCQNAISSKHPINKCTRYITPKEKVDKLKALNACIKCANLGHWENFCKFKFKRKCSKCYGWHFSFLCSCDSVNPSVKETVSNPIDTKPKQKQHRDTTTKKTTQSNVISPGASLQSNGGIDSLLPTFSCLIGNTKVRGLMDSGSQANFISERALEGQLYRIVKDKLQVTVNGFNGPRKYNSKLVEVKIKFGHDTYDIEAICVPEINLNLKLP